MLVLTLEQFLEHSCGMAPKMLVNYYEEHRDFVELYLAAHKNLYPSDDWEDALEEMWIVLPNLPKNFCINDS